MSSTQLVITAIAALLVILIGYVFIAQHTAKKRKQQQRLLQALKQRRQMFKDLAAGFPEGFLPVELYQLIHQVLLNVCLQLHSLEPQGGHAVDVNLYKKKLATPPSATKTPLDSSEKIKEARTLLQELLRYITAQREHKRMQKAQASVYIAKIRALTLQITIDDALLQAKKAHSENKASLALHLYKQIQTLLQKNAANPDYQQLSSEIEQTVNQLEAACSTAPENNAVDDKTEEKPSPDQDEWKKKQVYD